MQALTVARLGIAIGVLVLAAKWIAWRVTGSVALYSDALESIVNVIAATAAYGALRVARQPPDEDHPWGHGKAEYFSAVLEGVLISLAAVAIIHESIPKLLDPQPAESLGTGILFSTGASIANGLFAWFLLRAARHHRSPALRADGLHLLTDVWTTAGVVVGILAARWTGWWVLDPLLALGVALNILWVGWGVVRSSTGALMDEQLPNDELERLRALIVRTAAPNRIEGLRARRAGHHTFAEVRLIVPPVMTVGDSHHLCDRLEDVVRDEFDGAELIVHVEPEPDSN